MILVDKTKPPVEIREELIVKTKSLFKGLATPPSRDQKLTICGWEDSKTIDLYLFKPKDSEGPKPQIFFIHGGGDIVGGADWQNATTPLS